MITDGSENVVWSTPYQPYGTTGTITSTITQSIRLPGQYFDAETGFYYNTFRDYMPNLGHYLEADPIGLAGGINPYLYANANPGTNIDPSGLGWLSVFGMGMRWGLGSWLSSWTIPSGPIEVYGPDTEQTQEMMTAPGVQKAIQYYDAKNANKPCDQQVEMTNYAVHFGLSGLIDAGLTKRYETVCWVLWRKYLSRSTRQHFGRHHEHNQSHLIFGPETA